MGGMDGGEWEGPKKLNMQGLGEARGTFHTGHSHFHGVHC
jgi:hypothetical protein